MKQNLSKLVLFGQTAFDEISNNGKTARVIGGAGYYASIGASIASSNTLLVTSVGDDFDISAFNKPNLKTQLKIGGETAHFKIATDSYGQRTISAVCRGTKVIDTHELDKIVHSNKVFHICNMPPEEQLIIAKRIFADNKSFSFHSNEYFMRNNRAIIDELIELCNLYILDEKEYTLLDSPMEKCVVTLGERGACIPEANATYSPKTRKLVDKTGAGDIFSGAYVATLLETGDRCKALEFATEAASASVTCFGVEHLL